MMKRVYFDNGATSFPKAPGLGTVMANYIENDCVNINRTESSASFTSFDFLYDLRSNLCKLYNFNNPECVIFTKNITESLNFAIKGLFNKGDHVVVTSMEHNAVMRPLNQMSILFDRIPSDKFGYSDAKYADLLFKNNTKALIMSVANNVFGNIQPVEKLCKIAKSHGAMIILDTAQASPFVDIDMNALDIDVVCFTGHKGFLGPQGTGGFLIKKDLALKIDPLISGGTGSHSDSEYIPDTLPDRLTSGTENLVGLCGLAHSVSYVLSNRDDLIIKTRENLELLYKGLESISQLEIIGPTLDMPRTAVVSITSKYCDISDLAAYLSEKGIETRVGLHCSPSSHKTMGTFPTGTLRLSPGPFTSKDEIDYLLTSIESFFS